MNNVSLIGRLTADPELKHTQSEKGFTRFTVAVDRPTRQGEEKQANGQYCYEYNVLKNHLSKKRADDFIVANAGDKSRYVYLHGHEGSNFNE